MQSDLFVSMVNVLFPIVVFKEIVELFVLGRLTLNLNYVSVRRMILYEKLSRYTLWL